MRMSRRRPIERDWRVRRHVQAIGFSAIERLTGLVHNGHEVELACAQMLRAKVTQRISDAAAIDRISVALAKFVCRPSSNI